MGSMGRRVNSGWHLSWAWRSNVRENKQPGWMDGIRRPSSCPFSIAQGGPWMCFEVCVSQVHDNGSPPLPQKVPRPPTQTWMDG